ncbi:TadE/TadG family type IV pilus assembly protein [Streptomyces sp. H27-D2]|uniref:TadE/TadG family type IV pilus assembly protein n=1 Tax=Streptomyces sp. H27-D2 TaxID=3046304 RepID=UPI002DBCF549|nr:TadE/TadG family type IV pilus assembly protein [Streptomyces sp. H27-D2]MEC4017116.1 TadE/TadG family type IV pilus assembly protein [Streptomyces sp. H27-D2]
MTGERGRAKRRGERGQVSLELIGFLPILMLIALVGVQLGLGAYTAQQAGTAARAAARTESRQRAEASAETAGKASVSEWLRGGTDIRAGAAAYDEATWTAEIDIPSIIPGFDDGDFGTVRKTATMPRD